LRVKVKGEGKNFELAECAMRRGVYVCACVVNVSSYGMVAIHAVNYATSSSLGERIIGKNRHCACEAQGYSKGCNL